MIPSETLLLPCPFCGGAPVLEPDPWRGESVRVACANVECGVAPRSEYLLLRFVDELRAAWNRRDPGTAVSHRDTEARRREEGGISARFRVSV